MQYYYKLFFFQLEIYTVYADIANPTTLPQHSLACINEGRANEDITRIKIEVKLTKVTGNIAMIWSPRLFPSGHPQGNYTQISIYCTTIIVMISTVTLDFNN